MSSSLRDLPEATLRALATLLEVGPLLKVPVPCWEDPKITLPEAWSRLGNWLSGECEETERRFGSDYCIDQKAIMGLTGELPERLAKIAAGIFYAVRRSLHRRSRPDDPDESEEEMHRHVSHCPSCMLGLLNSLEDALQAITGSRDWFLIPEMVLLNVLNELGTRELAAKLAQVLDALGTDAG
ncbi:MAG: hypothetical protein V1826_01960 [bacterium]